MSIILTRESDLKRAYNIQNVPVQKVKDNPFDGKISQVTNRDKEFYKSSLGTPVIADITFKGSSYIDEFGRLVTFEDVKLITILINAAQPKNIVKTDIQGRNGSIKEYIGKGDYAITINGIITGDNGHYPIDEVRSLKAIIDAPMAIEVVSRYLQNLDVFNLVIEDHAFDQEAGGYSKQNFTLNCISDEPVILKIY